MIEIKHKDQTYQLPESLMEITLWQRIDFWNKIDKDHEAKIRVIYEKNAPPKQSKTIPKTILNDDLTAPEPIPLTDDDAYTLSMLDMERAVNAYSYFGNIPKEIVENELPHREVYGYYCDVLQCLITDDIRLETVNEFEWRGEKWVIPDATLINGDCKTMREVASAFELLRLTDLALKDYAVGKVSILLPLCCIWLKREGEKFDVNMMSEDGERSKLFKELPLEIALQVGFFLRFLWSTFMPTLIYSLSKRMEAKE